MNPLERMELSLNGLSVGDALGETFFVPQSVAIAAALAFRVGEGEAMSARQFLGRVVEKVSESETRSGIQQAVEIPISRSPSAIAQQLGSGQKISAQDTVPFALWLHFS